MNDEEFYAEIDKIPNGGWRNQNSGREYRSLGSLMCNWGFDDQQVLTVLSRAYNAATEDVR